MLLMEFVFYSVQVVRDHQRSSVATVKLLGVENVQIMQQKPRFRPLCWISCSAALPLVVGRLETHSYDLLHPRPERSEFFFYLFGFFFFFKPGFSM